MNRESVLPAGDGAGERPVRADARRNRSRILEAAEAVFAEQGASASTEAVAAASLDESATATFSFDCAPCVLLPSCASWTFSSWVVSRTERRGDAANTIPPTLTAA